MEQSPVNSFFRFLGGFLLLISLSFCITYVAHTFANAKDAQQAAAAALAAMLEQHPN